MRALIVQLRQALRKAQMAEFAKDRNRALAEANTLVDQLAVTEEKDLRFEVQKLLAAVGKGDLFPGVRYYIRWQSEFDRAIDGLRGIVGDVEDIVL